jgi:hypothetical protein
MTNTKTHAKRELELLEKNVPDALVIPFKREILALCEKFGKSGQSGGSGPYTASAISQTIEKLLMYGTLVPLTGKDSEWIDVTEMNDGVPWYQNKRDSRVFKDENNRCFFIDAIVFDHGDGRFTGNGITSEKYGNISSSQYVRSFPFTPKTFYVDVIKDENDEKTLIKDDDQLKEVFEYYDKM